MKKLIAFAMLFSLMLSMHSFTPVLAASKLQKVKGVVATSNAKAKTIKITFKKVKGAGGYAIYKNTKKNFKKVKAVFVKKPKKTFKKLNTNKTYYFKIRAYKNTKKGKKYGVATVKKVRWATTPQTQTTTEPTTQAPPEAEPQTPHIESARLIVKGKDLTHLNMTTIDFTNKCARIPLLTVIRELGYSITWDGDEAEFDNDAEHFKASPTGRIYSCWGIHLNYLEMPKDVSHEPYFLSLGGEFIVDTDSARTIIVKKLGANLRVNFETKTVTIGMYEKIEDETHKDATLIINNKPFYASGFATVSKNGDGYRVPLLGIAQELGADVDWIEEEVAEIIVDNKKYILDAKKQTLEAEDNSLDYLAIYGCPCPLFCEKVLEDCVVNSVHIDRFLEGVLGAEISVDYEKATITVTSK